MKSKGLIITLIILLSVIALSLLGFMFLFINGNMKRPNFLGITKVSTQKILDETYEKEFQKIEVDSSISDIYFKKSMDGKVRVVIHGEKKELNVEENDNELSIRFREKKCVGFCFNMTKNKIEIYLPEAYQGNLMLKNNYGDIKVANFNNANIEVDEDCGDVSIASAKDIVVRNDYGDIKIGTVQNANLKESCGDIEVGTVENITVKNNYGDISIKKVLNYISAEEDCGDIEIDNLYINKDSSIKNAFGSIEIGTTNEVYIDAKTDLGDVEIERNFRAAKTILTVRNNCGDITVENKE